MVTLSMSLDEMAFQSTLPARGSDLAVSALIILGLSLTRAEKPG